MPEPSQKYFLTTPIYYVNARPHIGHAYTTIVADVLARRHRLLGDDTFFLTGTDEHGQKIERSAAAAGVPPQQFANQVSGSFKHLWDRMGITYDDYIRTTEPRHHRAVQKLFRTLEERGHIYLDSYTGAYCVSDEAFVDAPSGTPCPDCGRLLETVTEENYFFRLSNFQQPLLDLIESSDPENQLIIEPESRRNEVLSFVRGGLRDLSVSRSSFTWGIPVPGNEKHVIYVWLDALANYMTAVGYGSDDPVDIEKFAKYWPADLHIVGKEIIRFHCVYWPAFLLAAGLPLPKKVVAHGWLLFEESKMSKSKGNIVRTETILDAFGPLCPPVPTKEVIPSEVRNLSISPEAPQPTTKVEQDLFAADILRYFLLREIPFGQDGSFSFDALITRYNADLANGYGNLVSRTLSMISKYFDCVIPTPSTVDRERFEGIVAGVVRHDSNPNNSLDFADLLEAIWGMLASTDAYITRIAPWKLATEPSRRQDLADVLYNSAEFIRIYTALCHQYLPFAAANVWRQLGLGDIEAAARNGELKNLQWGGLKPGTRLGPLSPIFPRADKGLAQIMTDMESASSPKPPSEESVPSVASALSLPPEETTAASAGPRTAAFDEPNPGTTVGGSSAITTERHETPSHTEAASGIFAHQPFDASPQIAIDDFAKIELRVAKVIVAERIPKADKLLRLEVDLGYEKRQILSGIAEWYTPEDLLGRRVVVITNLAPRKMRGLESHGMLLAACSDGGKPALATFLDSDDLPLGSRLK